MLYVCDMRRKTIDFLVANCQTHANSRVEVMRGIAFNVWKMPRWCRNLGRYWRQEVVEW